MTFFFSFAGLVRSEISYNTLRKHTATALPLPTLISFRTCIIRSVGSNIFWCTSPFHLESNKTKMERGGRFNHRTKHNKRDYISRFVERYHKIVDFCSIMFVHTSERERERER